MTTSFRTPLFGSALVALTLAACGGTKDQPIDNAGMEESAKSAGPSTQAIATLDASADQGTIESNIETLGADFSALVSQHQAYAAASTRVVQPFNLGEIYERDILNNVTLISDADGTATWDGSHLQANYNYTDDSSEAKMSYVVDLTFTDSGDGSHVIDGSYVFDWDLSTSFSYKYHIDVAYNNFTIDSDGCATAGSLEFNYDYDFTGIAAAIPGAGLTHYKGHILATFEGCGNVTLVGTN